MSANKSNKVEIVFPQVNTAVKYLLLVGLAILAIVVISDLVVESQRQSAEKVATEVFSARLGTCANTLDDIDERSFEKYKSYLEGFAVSAKEALYIDYQDSKKEFTLSREFGRPMYLSAKQVQDLYLCTQEL